MKIEDLKRVEEAATEAPWSYVPREYHMEAVFGPKGMVAQVIGDSPETEATAQMIATARNHFPALLKVASYATHHRYCDTYLVGMDRCCTCGFAAVIRELEATR